MALKAIFVGINKHLDAAVPELSGARRDAVALWALFTDTIDGLAARLLVDEAATHAEVSRAILGTLLAAQADDVVVISFAGHGSPDGSLVLFDTDVANFQGTALPMADLAEAFKTTQARAVLCILDCCFSGQAPARVLETAARPRSAFALAGVYGEGRILLAACATSKSAWEQPGTGHGLLTNATIEALTKAEGELVSFPEVAGEIVRLTRVEPAQPGQRRAPVAIQRRIDDHRTEAGDQDLTGVRQFGLEVLRQRPPIDPQQSRDHPLAASIGAQHGDRVTVLDRRRERRPTAEVDLTELKLVAIAGHLRTSNRPIRVAWCTK